MSGREMEVEVVDHQAVVVLEERVLAFLGDVAREVSGQIAGLAGAGAAWRDLSLLDVALVDDATIADVHGQFMGDPTSTDVITFGHGEIVIGVETAVRQAAEHGEPLPRELARYLVHGMLHLAGFDDREAGERVRMIEVQERLVAGLWQRLAGLHDLAGS